MKLVIFGLLILAISALGQQCNNAKIVNVRTATSENSKISTETAYIVQFKAQCQNNARNIPFYGEIDGKFLISSADATGEMYEISWSEPIKKARSGEISVRIFDEEGYGAFRKAQRSGDMSNVKELHTVKFYHQGTYKGPSIQIEFLVTILFGIIFYFARSSMNKIQG